MANEPLLTPGEIRDEIKNELGEGFVSDSIIDEFINENAGLLNRLLETQLAKVLKHRLDRPNREKGIGNILQLMCWNLVSDSINCSGAMCNKGEGSDRLCAGLKQHRDQILALIPAEEEIRKQERKEMSKAIAHIEASEQDNDDFRDRVIRLAIGLGKP